MTSDSGTISNTRQKTSVSSSTSRTQLMSLLLWLLDVSGDADSMCFYAGNIDQAQYCDKIKGIVDFLGSRLSVDELAMIWKIQVGCFVPLFFSCVFCNCFRTLFFCELIWRADHWTTLCVLLLFKHPYFCEVMQETDHLTHPVIG